MHVITIDVVTGPYVGDMRKESECATSIENEPQYIKVISKTGPSLIT
jgi:hypothetical protein